MENFAEFTNATFKALMAFKNNTPLILNQLIFD